MSNENKTDVASVEAPSKKQYQKREPIYDVRFSFTDSNMLRVKIRNNKKMDRRYDEKITGLAVVLRDTGTKTFYAFKNVEMFNKENNTWGKNVIYKKMFQFAKNSGFNCDAAREKVSSYLDKILDSRTTVGDEITVGQLCKKYIDTGINGFRIGGRETLEYKDGVKKHYSRIINSYILLNGCTDRLKDKLTAPIEYGGRVYAKPLKDFKAKELTFSDLEAFKFRMKDTKAICNNALALLSVVYTWSKMHKFFMGENPCKEVMKYPTKAHRTKLSDDKKLQILDHCEGKAFDYNPHFLTLVAMGLYTGCRGTEMMGLRWEEPATETEKEKCSGWLESGWENLEEDKFAVLWDTKNRKEFKPFLRRPMKELLIRLRTKLYNDKNFSWCLNSVYIFPKTRFKQHFPLEHTDSYALVYPMHTLNEKFGLKVEINGRLKNTYTLKIGRKTFVSQVASNMESVDAKRLSCFLFVG